MCPSETRPLRTRAEMRRDPQEVAVVKAVATAERAEVAVEEEEKAVDPAPKPAAPHVQWVANWTSATPPPSLPCNFTLTAPIRGVNKVAVSVSEGCFIFCSNA